MKLFSLVSCLLLSTSAIFAQGALGTITGTVADPSGAVVGNAAIEVHNTSNGQIFRTVSTATGNYNIAELPVGTYDLTATVSGFKSYKRTGLDLAAAQIMRIDIPLEVGAQTESVTVTAEASLLKTESGDLTHNVTVSQMDQLPVLSVGGTFSNNTSGYRDPLALAKLIPGVQYNANNSMVVDGVPNNTIQIRVDGQTSSNQGFMRQYTAVGQSSVDAIQEVAVQTSNFAAEYGAVGGAVFNATMKSGTNQLHGSFYDYAANDIMNAAQPYTGLNPPTRRHDYGMTAGGPVYIPKLYDGRNKSFIFFSFEEFRENVNVTNTSPVPTVPTQAYRNGNFAQVIAGQNNIPVNIGSTPYIDPLGRQFPAGTIFNPYDQQTVTCVSAGGPGQPNCTNGNTYVVRNPFVGNQIPTSLFDPVAVRILNLVPLPTGPNFASGQTGNNYQNPYLSQTRSKIPSVKGDQTFGSKQHVSFYGGSTLMDAPYTATNGNAEGFPSPVTGARGSFIYSYTYRLNYDYTITPTLLLHLGAGWYHENFADNSPATTTYVPSAPQTCTNTPTFGGLLPETCTGGLGLSGATLNRNFPYFVSGGLGIAAPGTTTAPGTGGMSSLGPFAQSTAGSERRPSGLVNATWVKNNHTFKIGAEWRAERYPGTFYTGTAGQYTFAANSTQQIAMQDQPTPSSGSFGFPFASFLLGNETAVTLDQVASPRTGKQQYGVFFQDTWKVTRKLTVDYGLRWDYGTYGHEANGLAPNFSPTTANPSAGGHPGAQIYEANCNCNFATDYPYAIGPRLGVAYQINSKTVIRGGAGVVYQATPVFQLFGAAGNSATTGGVGYGQYVGQLANGTTGLALAPAFPNLTPNAGQAPGAVVAAPGYLDPNSDRPARQYQWSINLQREITRNFVVEASYVGNRGVWWPAAGLTDLNAISVPTLSQYGFTVGNAADSSLLNTQLQNLTAAQKSTLAARGVVLPYSNFPLNQTVRQSIYPFPQYQGAFGPGPNIAPTNPPLGKTWYDAFQLNVTKRLSHGLTVNANYTYSKNLDLMSSPDIFNRDLGKNYSANDLPNQFRLSAQYTTPNVQGKGFLSNHIVAYALKDWGIGTYLQYQSAPIIALPTSTSFVAPISNYLGRGPGPAQLIPGMNPWSVNWTDLNGVHHTDPLDINCHCFDPTKTQVFNPAAWTNVPDGQWANDFSTIRNYRGFRYPAENFNFSRNFRFKERVSLNVRVEFTNAFNRTQLPQPTGGSFQTALTTQTSGPYAGVYNGGFGSVVPITGTQNARTGLLVGRLTF
jgi:hypothetical protein